MKLTRSHSQKGFTIVELLVVIVVIGILAAISVVAYSGVQQRARDTKRVSDVDHIAKALTLWATGDNGRFLSSGMGINYATVGLINSKNPTASYSTISIKEFFTQRKYLNDTVQEPAFGYESRDYAVTLCQDSDAVAGTEKNRRVVMARLETPPTKTLAQQLPECGGSGGAYWFNYFQTFYGVNYAVMANAE